MARRLRVLVAELLADRMLERSDDVLSREADAVEKKKHSVLHAAERAVREILKS